MHFAAGEQRRWLHGLGVRWFPLVQWAERGGHLAPGHGNSVPRFHVTWGTGPGLLEPFVRAVTASPRVRLAFRHRVTELHSGASGVAVSGSVLAPHDGPRATPAPHDVVGEFSLRAGAVVVASGGIGGNLDLVRRCWPTTWGTPPEHLVAGVPAHVDGSGLLVTERAGGRLIGSDRMWHYPEGVLDHSPVWPAHGIRVLPGPSSLWLDSRGERLPAPLFPGFDALGALRHLCAGGHGWSWFVLDEQTVAAEIALSGSEQNADLTGRSLRGVASRVRPGPTPEVRAFLERGEDFLTAASVAELVGRMNALTGQPLLDADRLRTLLEARDSQVRSGFGKDPQVVAVRAARRFVGDRLIRVARPHPFLDPGRPGEGRAGPGGALVAVRLHVLTRKTLGGLETDLDGRVLQPDGRPLPGVYAAGEAAGFGGGGMHGYRSLEGTFLGGCLFSGRTAGRAVAAAW